MEQVTQALTVAVGYVEAADAAEDHGDFKAASRLRNHAWIELWRAFGLFAQETNDQMASVLDRFEERTAA